MFVIPLQGVTLQIELIPVSIHKPVGEYSSIFYSLPIHIRAF